ncbi:MAG: LCP family protein [Candidatus Riflebacteria bacterium]|nr:LCP family protein [Candidatus Riflebacteria bacterium]
MKRLLFLCNHGWSSFSGQARRRRGVLLLEIVFLTIALTFFAGVMHKWFLGMVVAPIGINWVEGNAETGEKPHIGNVNVLVLGVDSVDGTHRADTMFILGLNPAKGRISMLSVPRDTRVLINGRARKINEILPRYGVEVLRSLLQDLLGIQINRYVEVGFQSFVNVIDILGGIDLDIDKAMHYDDNWGKVHIHLEPGLNHLDGRQALNYVRFRADAAADLGRIKRQQKFMKVLLEKVMTPGIVVKLPQIINQAFEHVQTDFSLAELYALTRGFEGGNIQFRNNSLPGEARYIDKISYFMPYQDEATALGSAQFSDLAAIELVASFTPVASAALETPQPASFSFAVASTPIEVAVPEKAASSPESMPQSDSTPGKTLQVNSETASQTMNQATPGVTANEN